MAYSFYRFIYFTFATVWGYLVLKDEYWMPWQLGGSGYYVDTFKEMPYGKSPSGLKEYLLITMGFHVGGLITHFFGPRRNDFLEMTLHHLAALYLFGGCYLLNLWEIGGVIAFLHDIADVTTNFVKFLADTDYTNATVFVFISHMVIWAWTRNLVLPYFVYTIWTQDMAELKDVSTFVKPFFCYLLSCMIMLHYYWFSLFVLMLVKYSKTNQTEDE